METKIPTHDEIRTTFTSVRDLIQRNHLCLDATIDDYPIGRRERGKCRLQVERAAGKGYRTVRTTTNKFGRRCAPKKSTYRNGVYVVIRDYDEGNQVVWLSAGNPAAQYGGITWGSSTPMAAAWRWQSAGVRTPHGMRTTTTPPSLGRHVLGSPRLACCPRT